MSFYQKQDFNIVDYSLYQLEGIKGSLRGPQPKTLEPKKYFTCLGSAHTFGRFCEYPYPFLLQQLLDLEVLNLGFGSAGPEWLLEQDSLIEYINNSQFVVIQIVSARGSSNSLYTNKRGGLKLVRRSDGKEITTERVYQELLKSGDVELLSRIVAETRQTWIDAYQQLLAKITVPKILFWFSHRQPDYLESYENLRGIWYSFPQLVNLNMINEIKKSSEEYVKCISIRGIPQPLINRFTGESVTLTNPNETGCKKKYNNYYPSPEMHVDAAHSLVKVCKKYLESVQKIVDLEADFASVTVKTPLLTANQTKTTIIRFINEKVAENLLAEGKLLQKAGKIEPAIQAYQKALEFNPRLYEAYCNLGDVFRKTKNWEQAVNYFTMAIQVQPGTLKADNRLVNVLRNARVDNIALEKLEYMGNIASFIIENKHILGVLNTLGLEKILLSVTIKQGKYDEAISQCQKLTKHKNQKLRPEFVEKYWGDGILKGPDFIIIGVAKCGTTSLYDYICKNPRVLPATMKEIKFFSKENL